MRLVALALVLAACTALPDEVRLTGTVHAGPGAADGLGGAALSSFDVFGAPHAEATADDAGRFELLAPAGDVVFVDIEADGWVRTTHTGVAGLQHEQPVEEGMLYGISEALFADQVATFAGCPGLDAPGGAVFGEVRMSNLREEGSTEHPTIATAVVSIDDGAGNTWEACYLDEEGLAFDPDAQWTGASGRFALFGVPAGEYRLTVSYQVVEGDWSSDEYPVRVTDGGVSPWFPLWTDFEI